MENYRLFSEGLPLLKRIENNLVQVPLSFKNSHIHFMCIPMTKNIKQSSERTATITRWNVMNSSLCFSFCYRICVNNFVFNSNHRRTLLLRMLIENEGKKSRIWCVSSSARYLFHSHSNGFCGIFCVLCTLAVRLIRISRHCVVRAYACVCGLDSSRLCVCTILNECDKSVFNMLTWNHRFSFQILDIFGAIFFHYFTRCSGVNMPTQLKRPKNERK